MRVGLIATRIPVLARIHEDRRGDIPQVLLLIGLIAIPIALFLTQMADDVRDNTRSNVNELVQGQNPLKKY